MNAAPASVALSRRLAERDRPSTRPVGFQRWSELLFLHWEVPRQQVQATLPAGLFVDTWEGRSFVGVVPFFMERVRPAGLPPLPWLSWFQELNVRTYVVDAHGRPGVWFYSLDCDQPIAVWVARRLFHLPYQHARFRSAREGGVVTYEARRLTLATPDRFQWKRGGDIRPAEPGSLEFFLVERYRLFAANRRGELFTGRVHHAPYPVCVPEVTAAAPAVGRAAGFQMTGPAPLRHAVAGVDVAIHPLEAVR